MIRIDFEPPYPRLAERTITAITAEPGPYTGLQGARRTDSPSRNSARRCRAT